MTQLTEQFLRDLKWLSDSPGLIDDAQNKAPGIQIEPEWLCELAKAPERIVTFVQSKNLRMLGPYYESLWEFYFTFHPDFQLVGKNIQVFDKQQTLGEFDFIYQDCKTQNYYHLEVAVKYYLGVPEADFPLEPAHSPQHRWLGPNENDRLDKKYQKMLNQQSKLALTAAGERILSNLGAKSVSSVISLQGVLFYPTGQPLPAPEKVNPAHNRGSWCPLGDMDRVLGGSSYWRILEKPFWLSADSCQVDWLLNPEEIKLQVSEVMANNSRPILISGYPQVTPGSAQILRERLVFIVPDDWPKKPLSRD